MVLLFIVKKEGFDMSERIQKIDSVKLAPKQSYSSQNLPQKRIFQIRNH